MIGERSHDSLKRECRTLGDTPKFMSFPWEYCPSLFYHIEDFENIDGPTRTQQYDFERIHSMLYPDGYELPLFWSQRSKIQKIRDQMSIKIQKNKQKGENSENPPEQSKALEDFLIRYNKLRKNK